MAETLHPQPDSMLPTLNQLLHSLLQSTSHVQIMKAKWLIITAKLATLLARLSAIPSAAALNPISSELLSSIFSTCSSAASLDVLCHSLSLPAGKLRTQNELDSLSTKLDTHINDLQVLLNTENDAVLFPAVSASSKTELARSKARNLMTRLQIGSNESKNSALDLLLGLLQEDDKNVVIAVALGIVPILVHLMDSSCSSELKEKSVAVISKISLFDSSKHVLVAEGFVLLNNLMRVLESGSLYAKEKSCNALQVLSSSKENARAIVSRGGVSSLLGICQEGTPNSQAFAAGVLRNLSVFEEIKEKIIEEKEDVLTLLELCNSGTALAQRNSIECLCNLVSGNDDLKVFVAKEGGIDSITNFWDSTPNVNHLEVAVQMVATLASCHPIAELLVANGFLHRIIDVLSCEILGVRIAALNTLSNLACNNKIRKALGGIGCIGFVVSMLDGKAMDEKEAAVQVLRVLMNYGGNRKIFMKEEKGIVTLVQLLGSKMQGMKKKYLVWVLGSVVHSKSCRKQMVAAGACVYLEQLVEMEVEGAKKLLDSLERTKLWGVFG